MLALPGRVYRWQHCRRATGPGGAKACCGAAACCSISRGCGCCWHPWSCFGTRSSCAAGAARPPAGHEGAGPHASGCGRPPGPRPAVPGEGQGSQCAASPCSLPARSQHDAFASPPSHAAAALRCRGRQGAGAGCCWGRRRGATGGQPGASWGRPPTLSKHCSPECLQCNHRRSTGPSFSEPTHALTYFPCPLPLLPLHTPRSIRVC